MIDRVMIDCGTRAVVFFIRRRPKMLLLPMCIGLPLLLALDIAVAFIHPRAMKMYEARRARRYNCDVRVLVFFRAGRRWKMEVGRRGSRRPHHHRLLRRPK